MEPTEYNRRAWDEIHRRRPDATAIRLGIPDPVRERLPDVAGKHVLHLQCGTGESTAQLAELGALVTGVEVSSEAIAIAHERAPTAAFVQSDLEELPIQLERGRFDLVYTGGGVFHRFHDLDRWAAGVAAALRPGGALLAFDDHPVAACVDPTSHWRRDYFSEEEFERLWRLGQIVTAVAGAGLAIRSLEEFSSIYKTYWREKDPRVPGQFILLAEKPRRS